MTAHFAVLSVTVLRQGYSRRFVRENITRSLALSVRKRAKLLESVNIINK